MRKPIIPEGFEPNRFRLIGRTNEFVVIRRYLAAGFIPSVIGRTLDGKFQTAARISDIEFLNSAA